MKYILVVQDTVILMLFVPDILGKLKGAELLVLLLVSHGTVCQLLL